MLGPSDARGLSRQDETAGVAAPTVTVTRLAADRLGYSVTMTLPTPCHSIGEGVAEMRDGTTVMIHRIATTGDICAQVLTEARVDGEVALPAAGAPVALEVIGLDGTQALLLDLAWQK